MSKETYDSLVDEIEKAQLAVQKSQKQYRRLKRFKVINICGISKLVTRQKPMKYYLYVDEIFDIIEAAHVAIGHGGRDRPKNETSRIYANITLEMINIFLSMCETCQRKKSMKKKGLVSKPILHSEMNSRCQVDLIDMQTQEDRGFKFIMVYQDHLTKFVLLRALKSKRAAEVAYQLTDIFLTFDAPCILHSDNGQSQGSVERANQDIEKMLASWMQDNNTTNWSNGIRFVQFMKNRALHSGIKQSPYKAMFGIEPRVGLMTSTLPRDVIEDIRDEDDLENALNKINMTDSTDTAETEPVASRSGEHQIITGAKQKAAESSSKTSEESPVEVEASQYDIEAGASTAEEPLIIPPNDKDIEVITNVNQQIMTSREAAHQNLKKQARRMTLASDKIHVPVEIGDNVIIQIPDVDRAKANLRNIVRVVLQKDDQDFHKIGTKYAMLDKLYCRSELDKCKEKFLHEEDVPNTSLPLRTVAREASIGTGQGFMRCVCKKGYPRKKVYMMSSLHHDKEIDVETETFYNQTKSGVDVVDKLSRTYDVSRYSKRWPLTIFFALLNHAGINNMIKHMFNNGIEKNKTNLIGKFIRELGLSLIRSHLETRRQNQRLPRELRQRIEKYFQKPLENIQQPPAKRSKYNAKMLNLA
ncbi:unnamed protein product [Danaus chrysippus]|uniref:(African queen) hypothetical protein n=1 Tax=Danaus chrysippus TaxID=151541 RepID=A0A8J2QEU2_9NEOP|nr:unnamed protein product [Danaus chrysippus]